MRLSTFSSGAVRLPQLLPYFPFRHLSSWGCLVGMRPQHAQRSQGLTSPHLQPTQRQESQKFAQALRLDFLQWITCIEARIGLNLGQHFPRLPSLFGDPLAFCPKHHGAPTRTFPNVMSPYAEAEVRVTANQAPLFYVTNLKRHTVGGQPVSSQIPIIRSIAINRSRFAPVLRGLPS
jgi:hypothetical protein